MKPDGDQDMRRNDLEPSFAGDAEIEARLYKALNNVVQMLTQEYEDEAKMLHKRGFIRLV